MNIPIYWNLSLKKYLIAGKINVGTIFQVDIIPNIVSLNKIIALVILQLPTHNTLQGRCVGTNT